MLIEGVKLSNGQVLPLAVDDDGKLLISGVTLDGDVTIGAAVEISNDEGNPVPVSGTVTAEGPLTDTELRATAVSVSGPLTDTQLRAADVKVTLDSEAVVIGAGSATIGKLGANSGVDIGDVDVTSLPSLPAGTNLIGKVGSDTASTAALSNVSGTASNTTMLAANANRKRVVIVNDSTATLYLKFGATASATSFTYLLYGGDTYESPSNPIYTGQIDGIWSSATGAARVTEFT
jgi:hypothetical protein